MHANSLLKGFPDLYATHAEYGMRLIEVKVKGQYKFTIDQLKKYPILHSNGAPIYIMCSDEEYDTLFELGGNFPDYLRPYEKKNILKYIGKREDWDQKLILGDYKI